MKRLFSLVLMLIFALGAPTSANETCNVDRKADLGLTEYKMGAQNLRTDYDILSPEQCFERCCTYWDNSGNHCNAVSFYRVSELYPVCVLLSCIPFDSCVWSPSINFTAARIQLTTTPDTVQQSGINQDPMVNQSSEVPPPPQGPIANDLGAAQQPPANQPPQDVPNTNFNPLPVAPPSGLPAPLDPALQGNNGQVPQETVAPPAPPQPVNPDLQIPGIFHNDTLNATISEGHTDLEYSNTTSDTWNTDMSLPNNPSLDNEPDTGLTAADRPFPDTDDAWNVVDPALSDNGQQPEQQVEQPDSEGQTDDWNYDDDDDDDFWNADGESNENLWSDDYNWLSDPPASDPEFDPFAFPQSDNEGSNTASNTSGIAAEQPGQPFNQPEQPFNQPIQPFNQPIQPNQPEQPFNQPEQPFNQPAQPFNQLEQPFNQPIQPPNQPEQPFNLPEQPFRQLEQPFNQQEQPFNQPGQNPNQPEQPFNQPEQNPNLPEQPFNQPEQNINQPEQPFNQPEQNPNQPEQPLVDQPQQSFNDNNFPDDLWAGDQQVAATQPQNPDKESEIQDNGALIHIDGGSSNGEEEPRMKRLLIQSPGIIIGLCSALGVSFLVLIAVCRKIYQSQDRPKYKPLRDYDIRFEPPAASSALLP